MRGVIALRIRLLGQEFVLIRLRDHAVEVPLEALEVGRLVADLRDRDGRQHLRVADARRTSRSAYRTPPAMPGRQSGVRPFADMVSKLRPNESRSAAVSSQKRVPYERRDAVRPVVGFGAVLVRSARSLRSQRLRTRRPASSRISVNTLSTVVPAAIDADVIASTRKCAPTSIPLGRFALQLHHRLDHARRGLAVVRAAHDDVVVRPRPSRPEQRRGRRSGLRRSCALRRGSSRTLQLQPQPPPGWP